MAAKDERGRAGEERACRFLRRHGYRVVDRNWSGTAGELDIIALRRGLVAVVEVKTRRSLDYGDPLAAVDARKLHRLWTLGFEWARTHPRLARGRAVRVDIIGITGQDPATAEVVHLEDVR